ncbi:MAG: hypothetical protein PHW52_03890 [Candidatus Pacebacteria bacterium]|nr:hypothetical protein [Candidatus Paceibacterota bacterium]
MNSSNDDKDLISLKKVLKEIDEELSLKIASNTNDPAVLLDITPECGSKAFQVASNRLRKLFPKEYWRIQNNDEIIRKTLMYQFA